MAQTFLQTQKAHAPGRHHRSGQRRDYRGYPDDGVPWGQEGWGSGGAPAPGGPATGATEGEPGTWSPAGCIVPTSTDLIAGVPNPVVATPTASWQTGWVMTSDAKTAWWTGTVWESGGSEALVLRGKKDGER